MREKLSPGWAWATLQDLVSETGVFSDGDWVESKDQDPDGEVRLIQLADVGVGEFRDRSNRFLTSTKAAELNCTYLEPDDVLVARMPDPLGRACEFPNGLHACVTVVDVAIVRPGPESVDPTWLVWSINSPQCRSQIEQLQSGTTRKRISRKNLATIRLAVPPLAEQKRIVDAIEEHFSRLDAAEATLSQSLTRLDALRSSTLADAFHSRRDLPCTWHWSILGEVAEVRSGIQKQPKRKPNKNPAPFLRVANVLRGELLLDQIHEIELFDGELERYRIRHGDLLVVEGNGSPAQIGRAASWSDQIANCVHQNHLIRVSPGPELSPKFLSLYWNAPHTASLLRDVASSTSGLYTLSTRKIKAIPIPIAPLSEQEQIATRVDGQLEKHDRLRESIRYALDRVTFLRRSVLATAFSGRLVPQDPEDEPASVLLERIAASRPTMPARQRRTA